MDKSKTQTLITSEYNSLYTRLTVDRRAGGSSGWGVGRPLEVESGEIFF